MKKAENQKFDLFYLKEDGKKNIKESFKFILSESRQFIEAIEQPRIVDVGCATGDFLSLIQHEFPSARLMGLDIQRELLSKAKSDLPGVEFSEFNIEVGDSTLSGKFDVGFMSGLHAAFDEPSEWIPQFLDLIHEQGVGFVYGNFNPEPIDVIVRVRPSGSKSNYMRNWNMISQATVESFLEEQGYASEFKKFEIPIDIAKRSGSPLRSWTFRYEDGSRGTVNGAQLLHQDYLLVIKRR